MGCCDFCLICDACSWICSFLGSVCVSSCLCCVFVSVVNPVAILNVVFCVICSLFMTKRHSLHEIGMLQASVQIVSTQC